MDAHHSPWPEVIAAYDAALADQEQWLGALLRGDEVARPVAFEPPADLPPAPPALASQLMELHRRTGELQQATVDVLGRIERRASRRNPAVRSGPTLIDRTI